MWIRVVKSRENKWTIRKIREKRELNSNNSVAQEMASSVSQQWIENRQTNRCVCVRVCIDVCVCVSARILNYEMNGTHQRYQFIVLALANQVISIEKFFLSSAAHCHHCWCYRRCCCCCSSVCESVCSCMCVWCTAQFDSPYCFIFIPTTCLNKRATS